MRQLYFGTGFRPAYSYRLRAYSDRTGRLTAMTHDIRGETSSYETFTEAMLAPGQMLYSMPNVRQAYATVPLDVNTPIWMRGPGYASAALVIESAMDELAHQLGIDPIELRKRNEPAADESSGQPFSTHAAARMLRRRRPGIRLATAQPEGRRPPRTATG